jgi:hypothetical protein
VSETEGAPTVASVRPQPEPAVLAAIVAAVQEAWPRPRPAEDDGSVARHPAWRFSGRWWTQPAAMRRDRPRAGR